MLNSQETHHLIETSYDDLNQNHISTIQENLAKAGVFPMVYKYP